MTRRLLFCLCYFILSIYDVFVTASPVYQHFPLIVDCPSWDEFLLGKCVNTSSLVFETEALFYPPINYSLADAVKEDVQYRLLRTSQEEGIILTEQTLESANIDKELPTVLFIHGWTTDETSPWYAPMKNAYLKQGQHNIFYIDWSKAGNKTYYVSAANTKPVGGFIGDFLLSSGINLDKIHIVGHSLGSHTSGFVGKHIFNKTGRKIHRITATDAAFPLFEHDQVSEADRLSKEDATFVDLIHTDAGYFGFTSAIGHVDYYPNGGKLLQPGCPSLEEDDNCSHAKSNVYFIASIGRTDILATECPSWEDYTNGECSSNNKIVFGQNVDINSRGIYYFELEADIKSYL